MKTYTESMLERIMAMLIIIALLLGLIFGGIAGAEGICEHEPQSTTLEYVCPECLIADKIGYQYKCSGCDPAKVPSPHTGEHRAAPFYSQTELDELRGKTTSLTELEARIEELEKEQSYKDQMEQIIKQLDNINRTIYHK